MVDGLLLIKASALFKLSHGFSATKVAKCFKFNFMKERKYEAGKNAF